MQKLTVELLSDFSEQGHIQIIYKPQLVYYLHKTFLFNQVNCFSQNGTIDLRWLVVLLCISFTTEAPHGGVFELFFLIIIFLYIIIEMHQAYKLTPLLLSQL